MGVQYYSAQEIADGLEKSKKTGKGWLACCPAHDDKNPSLAISETREGKVLVCCQSGCSQDDVIEALKSLDLWVKTQTGTNNTRNEGEYTRLAFIPPSTKTPEFSKMLNRAPTKFYDYRNVDGQRVGYVARIDLADGGKTFRPVTPWKDIKGQTVWRTKGFAEPYPLYRQELLNVRPDSEVLVVEGEKALEAAEKLFPNLVVVSWPGGAAAAGKAGWGALEGRSVTLWPDADDPGKKAMETISDALTAADVTQVKMVFLPEFLDKGWDLADRAPAGFDVLAVLERAVEFDPTIGRYFLTAGQLLDLKIPKPEFIIGTFMPTQSLSMVFAERGLGKTWFCLSLALAVASGTKFLCYPVHKPRRVLYVDGEMALGELQERLRALEPNPPGFLEVLSSEILYKDDHPLNLHDKNDQERVLAALSRRESKGHQPELIILDNLSSLSRGVDENSNSDLDQLLAFLMALRHRGYSVLLVHHAGKGGGQRGASRREDLLNLSIELRRPDDKKDKNSNSGRHEGAHFILEFSKVRDKMPERYRLDLKLTENGSGRIEWLIDDAPEVRRADEVLRKIAQTRPASQKYLASTLEISTGRVSQNCTDLRENGFRETRRKTEITVTELGYERIVFLWPEDRHKIDWQIQSPI